MKKFILILAVVVVMMTMLIILKPNKPTIIGYEEYTVCCGDTLWHIAEMSNGYNILDIREIIHDIEQQSNCTALIQVCDTVYIPIYDI